MAWRRGKSAADQVEVRVPVGLRVSERAIKAIYVHSHMDEETFDVERAYLCCDSTSYPDGTTIPVLMDPPVVNRGPDFALPVPGVSAQFRFRDKPGQPVPPLPFPITIKATLGDSSLAATVIMIA